MNHGSHFGIEVGSKTDIGRVRLNNEDTFAVAQEINLWVVSDGMGGEKHGELASAIAIETIVASCRSNSLLPPISTVHWSTSQSEAIVIECHLPGKPRDIQFRQPHSDQHGMGATGVAAWLDKNRLSLVNVGDSRA